MEAFGVLQTVLFAAGINLLVGISALIIHKESGGVIKFTLPKISIPKINWNPEQNFWMGISFICGFTALAYEVLWTRLLVFSIASTVYSFSMMLAVFLLGIFLGGLLLIPSLSRIKNPRTILILLQGVVGFYVISSIYSLSLIHI